MEREERVAMQERIYDFLKEAKVQKSLKESTSGADESIEIEASKDGVSVWYRVRFNRWKDIPLFQKIRRFFQ